MLAGYEARNADGWARLRNAALLLVKLCVTAGCLWYVAQQVNVAGFKRLFDTFVYGWAAIAVAGLIIEVPLVALRWRDILDALGSQADRTRFAPLVAITSITVFVAQILPNVAADALRVWLLVRTGRSWRQGLPSVIIDRALGLFSLTAIGFVTLLFPSALTALAGYRTVALGAFGAIIVAAMLGVFLVPYIAPVLDRFSLTRMAGRFALAAHSVLVGSRAGWRILALGFAVHFLTVFAIWSLARAQGFALPVVDAALLFTLMISISLLPVSIGGWGLRELAVSSLLATHGVPVEQALFFSVSFGLIVIVAALPGAVVWAWFSPARHVIQSQSSA